MAGKEKEKKRRGKKIGEGLKGSILRHALEAIDLFGKENRSKQRMMRNV